MQSSKRIFFFLGIATQIIVLCTSVFFLHNAHQKGTGELEEENFFSFTKEEKTDSETALKFPFAHFVTGNGRVLPSSGYIEITPGVNGEVVDVYVRPGDSVKEGDLLFQIDDSDYKFLLREKIAEYDASVASLKLLQEGPSHSILEAKEKEIDQIKIKVAQSEDHCSIFKTLLEKEAVTTYENNERNIEHAMLVKQLEKTLAEYSGLHEGPSPSELEIRKAHVKREEAQVQAMERRLRKCHATAPIAARVLAVNLHRGEHVSTQDKHSIVLGSDNPLHLKVHIEEKDTWRISPSKTLRAIAVHKSNPKLHFILHYVSFTPLLDKANDHERKLELTFAFDKGMSPIYLEELLDVYIEAASPTDTACLDYQFSQQR